MLPTCKASKQLQKAKRGRHFSHQSRHMKFPLSKFPRSRFRGYLRGISHRDFHAISHSKLRGHLRENSCDYSSRISGVNSHRINHPKSRSILRGCLRGISRDYSSRISGVNSPGNFHPKPLEKNLKRLSSPCLHPDAKCNLDKQSSSKIDVIKLSPSSCEDKSTSANVSPSCDSYSTSGCNNH